MSLDSHRPQSTEEELLQFFYQCPVGVVEIDADGAIGTINAMAAQLLMPLDEEATLDNLFRLLAPFDVILQKAIQAAGESGGKILDHHCVSVTHHGRRSYLDFTVLRRNVRCFMVAITDITRLHESQERLRLATEAAQLGIWSWRPETDVVEWENERSYQIFGISRSEGPINAARFAAEFVHPDDLAAFEQALACTVHNGASFAFQGRFRHRSGEWRWIEFTGKPVDAESGPVARVVGTAADITHIKRAEEKLRELAAALSEADRRKDVFMATLAHELRNPLSPIRTAAQILGAPQLTPEKLQWAQRVIQRQTTHMALLLDDLLDVARITQGKLEIKKRRISLNAVIESAIETARPVLDAKHHRLVVELPEGTFSLHADPLRLAQVISNLLTNAAKYTDAGGNVSLAANIADETLHIAVKDTGIGIPAEALPRIFTLFTQVDGSAARAEGGLGIGLALVRGLVELHGGTISAHSEGVGQGSEFTVHLPIDRVQATVQVDVDIASIPSVGLRVLVADDNRDAADSLTMLLEISGHEARAVYDGHAALAMAQTFRPQVALLDISMPALNGYELARELRGQPWASNICLIALTGWGHDSDLQRAMGASFDHHMTKPVDPAKLEALLTSHCLGFSRGA